MQNTQIILVDDDPIILKLQVRVLTNALGVSPKHFLTGTDVLDYLKSVYDEKSRFLILLDINMPGLSGWDVLNEIQKLPFHRDIKVALVTSSVDAYDKSKAAKYDSVVDFIEKPFRPNCIDRLKANPELSIFLSVLFAGLFVLQKAH